MREPPQLIIETIWRATATSTHPCREPLDDKGRRNVGELFEGSKRGRQARCKMSTSETCTILAGMHVSEGAAAWAAGTYGEPRPFAEVRKTRRHIGGDRRATTNFPP